MDLIDVVLDQEGVQFADPPKEDPTVYVSEKTGRGPLEDDWIDDYWGEIQSCNLVQPTPKNGRAIMCAYKLCKVEFRYWGMQSKIERFIHDVALRRTMLRAHSQAWTWQDEWHGLTMEDIRAIERETALLLEKRMRALEEGEEGQQEHLSSSAEGGGGEAGNEKKRESAELIKNESKEGDTIFRGIEYSDRDVPPNILPR